MHLRDQAPLHPSNMDLRDGMSFPDYIRLLNDRVFFWPGDERGPIPSGRNHFARYREEACQVIVCPTESLFRANDGRRAEFCRFNSGAPRFSGGKAPPRGRQTFRRAFEFDGTASDVIEVTWTDAAKLPADMRVVDPRRWRAE
ncbi:MAG: hypothetical protein H6809_08120 [Phycisphaeraceae bacterium]|nr:hypothetical protein [Phycisphaeraceae bacterium]